MALHVLVDIFFIGYSFAGCINLVYYIFLCGYGVSVCIWKIVLTLIARMLLYSKIDTVTPIT